MRRLFVNIGAVVMWAVGSVGQESRSEISVQQGTGFFTKDSNGRGSSQRSTETGGFTVGYRYHVNRWLSAEGNYGYDRNTQQYFGSLGESRIQANAHSVTGDLAVNLPLPIGRVSPYVLAGGGGSIAARPQLVGFREGVELILSDC
jgi:opacity protein-like surface antigen